MFILGLIIGAFIGIAVMCMVQVNRKEDTYERDIE